VILLLQGAHMTPLARTKQRIWVSFPLLCNQSLNIEGSTAGDEMCNLYLMYYTDAKIGTSYQICTDQCSRVPTLFPLDSDEPLPPNPLLEEHALHGSHGQENGTVVISNKMSINLVSFF
jgi:hypothetical protein